MSLHTDKAFHLAASKRAAAGSNYHDWQTMVRLSKRELIEIGLHLAAICTDSYDDAIASSGAFNRFIEERDALRTNGII